MDSQLEKIMYTCKCGAVFPAVSFCPFCSEKVPLNALLQRELNAVEVEQRLGIKLPSVTKSSLRKSSTCTIAGHFEEAESAREVNKIGLSKNGPIKFCADCGEKLPGIE